MNYMSSARRFSVDEQSEPVNCPKTPWESAAEELLSVLRILCFDVISSPNYEERGDSNGRKMQVNGGKLDGISPIKILLSPGDKQSRFTEEQWTAPMNTNTVLGIAKRYNVDYRFEASGDGTTLTGKNIASAFLDPRMTISVVFSNEEKK